MKSKTINRIILILLLVITWTTFRFITENRYLLFDDNSINGETRITLRILSDIDKEDIKQIVYQTSQLNIQHIDILEGTAGSKEAVVDMAYMDASTREVLTAQLQKEYGNDVEVLSAVSIGGSINLETRYKIFAALGIAIIIIIILLVLYVRAMKGGKRGLAER
jgi:preprotein translocase subunit SecF